MLLAESCFTGRAYIGRIADASLIEIYQEVSDLWDKTNVCSNRVFVWNVKGEGGGKENDMRLKIILLTGSTL